MKEIMYNQSSVLASTVLFVLMLLAIECGYRFGLSVKKNTSESYRAYINGLQSSLLGILALLIAFTFSIALQRFDSRSDAVVDEANAIGTTYLLTQLLPISVRTEVQHSLRDYLDLRVKESTAALNHSNERTKLLANANLQLDILWAYAIQAGNENTNIVTSGLFIQALNEMIDSFGRRIATVDRHVPEFVLVLLSFVLIINASVIGYSVGIIRQRPSLISYIMIGIIVLLVFIIIDLDRPRRGLIQVSQKSLIDLQIAISKDLIK